VPPYYYCRTFIGSSTTRSWRFCTIGLGSRAIATGLLQRCPRRSSSGNSGTAAASPERGSETRPRPEATWPCNSRSSRVALVTHRTTDRVQAVSARSQDIRRPHTRLHHRSAHTGRRHTNTLVAARLQQRQPLYSTDGAAIWRPCVLCRRAPCVGWKLFNLNFVVSLSRNFWSLILGNNMNSFPRRTAELILLETV